MGEYLSRAAAWLATGRSPDGSRWQAVVSHGTLSCRVAGQPPVKCLNTLTGQPWELVDGEAAQHIIVQAANLLAMEFVEEQPPYT